MSIRKKTSNNDVSNSKKPAVFLKANNARKVQIILNITENQRDIILKFIQRDPLRIKTISQAIKEVFETFLNAESSKDFYLKENETFGKDKYKRRFQKILKERGISFERKSVYIPKDLEEKFLHFRVAVGDISCSYSKMFHMAIKKGGF